MYDLLILFGMALILLALGSEYANMFVAFVIILSVMELMYSIVKIITKFRK